MEELAMCRVCLAEDVRLRLIANTHLQEMYESLSLLPLQTKDSRPKRVCYICCAELQNCYRLRKRCFRSEELLTHMLSSDVLQPLNAQEHCTQRLKVKHPVILLSIDDKLQNITDDDIEDSAHRTDVLDVLNPDTVQKQHNEVLIDIIKMEPQEDQDAQIDDDIQFSQPLDVMKREPDDIQTDVVAEAQDEQCVQIDDHNPCLHLDDPLDIIKGEADDVETDDEDVKLEIEDTILEEINENVNSWSSQLANNICAKIAKVALQRIDVNDSITGVRVLKKNKIAVPKNTEDATTNKRKIEDEKNEDTKYSIKEPKIVTKKTIVAKPVTKSKILDTCEKFDIKLNKSLGHNVCEEKSTNNSSLEHSLSNISNYKNKKYCCDICKKCFMQKCEIRTHIRIHTGEKPYQCNFCKKCFYHKNNLNNHIRTHTGEKPYKCSLCKKCFSRKNHLNYHIRTHTGEKPYQCNLCKKWFNRKDILNNHIRTHTGVKPYKCHFCKKCFINSSNLKRHIRTHTGEKPYKCHLCEKCFVRKGILKNHIRTHTKNHSK